MKRTLRFAILHWLGPLLLLGTTPHALAQPVPPAMQIQPRPATDRAGTPAASAHGAPMTTQAQPAKPKTKKLGIVIFPGFETLDVFGPVQMWGRLPDYELVMVSEHGGAVTSAQGVATVTTYSFATAPQLEILMIPGGMGTRTEVDNPVMLEFLRRQDEGTEWTTSVCTGSAVLAKAGLLKGRAATSNKLAYKFATSQDPEVHWRSSARWVVDGKYITSSGVSAGTDMALGLVEKLYGRAVAERIAHGAEYAWNDDPANDPFAVADGK